MITRLKGNVETIMQKGSYSKDELLDEVGKNKKIKNEAINYNDKNTNSRR